MRAKWRGKASQKGGQRKRKSRSGEERAQERVRAGQKGRGRGSEAQASEGGQVEGAEDHVEGVTENWTLLHQPLQPVGSRSS